jgi:signal transduction histidine kinase/DNA-binding response OmpR family regulator
MAGPVYEIASGNGRSHDDLTVSELFAGDGEMAALMRAKDWDVTALGPVAGWSPSLRMMVRFLVANRFPLLLWWGPEYASIYNDAYRPILGNKHPLSLAQPVRECWSEIWHILQPLIDTPFNGGPATWMEDIQLEIGRYDFVEETHFTVAYSPVPDETVPSGIGGVLATVHEISEKVVGERRVAMLRDLGARTGEAKSPIGACALAAEVVAGYALDIPFAAFYLIDERAGEAVLVGSVGMEGIGGPTTVALREDGQGCPWPLGEVARSQAAVTVEDLAARLPRIPAGPWSDPPKCAMVLPIHANRAGHLAGILVAGVSSRLRLDDQYRSFLDFASAQVATAIADATAYEEERRRAEALAEIDRAKTAFFSNASHEFRTPLTLMLGPLEDALSRMAPAETGRIERRELELIHRNGLRLLKLVNTLLDFSRIEAGRFQAFYEPTDLAAYTADLASTFRSAIERAGLDFTIDCATLPSPVHVDHDMWEKIVLNLLSNAFKFTLEGAVRVSLRPSPEGSAAILTVSDTGIGIPESELPRLFERFHRIEDQRGRSQEGTGIGLALVAELVRLHGGTVDVSSRVGQGSDFTVAIPIGLVHLPKDRIGAERTLASSSIRANAFVEEALRWLPGESAISRPSELNERMPDPPVALGERSQRSRILLADDNADMRDYVRRLLQDRYVIEAAADGEAALAAARANPPDLVLTDVMMPRLDGFGLLRALRNDSELGGIPVVLLSARAGEEAKVEGLEAGADDYLTKPFNARELLARVASNLELASARSRAAMVLRDEARRLEILNRTASTLAAEIELEQLVQTVTDAATELTGAKYGAFFYNVLNEAGESYLLYTLSGASREDFAGFPEPRNTAVFAPTFNGEGVVRSGDIRKDPRYGKNAPNQGPPPGHLPVVSYLAVPVVAPSREVLGGLFFAHPEPNRFTEQHELIAGGIASQAAIAFEKARLYDTSRKAQAELRHLNETLEQRIAVAVADRMKVEAALRQAQKMEAIGQLTGGVAHDFNNLLQVVLGNLDTLQRRIDDMMPARGEILRPLTAALRGAERAASVTQRLLAFSRRQPLDPRPIKVSRLVSGMSELLRRTLGETVEIETVLSGGRWLVSVDNNQLESAILNLAVNARDAMPDGGKLTIETANTSLDDTYVADHTEVQPGEYVMLAISDTGTGMTREVIASAFDPFFTTKQPGHGTGLGLSQVYGFVKQSNGHVKIYSEPGEGTTVRIYLPRLVGASAAPEDTSAARELLLGQSSEVILLVEDDELVRELNVETLRELGYHVLEAADGAEALRQLERVPNIRLLFTDVGLPGEFNGRQLADRALSLRPELKILFTTGYARGAIVYQGRLEPGVQLINKPFTAAALAGKVRELLGVEHRQLQGG